MTTVVAILGFIFITNLQNHNVESSTEQLDELKDIAFDLSPSHVLNNQELEILPEVVIPPVVTPELHVNTMSAPTVQSSPNPMVQPATMSPHTNPAVMQIANHLIAKLEQTSNDLKSKSGNTRVKFHHEHHSETGDNYQKTKSTIQMQFIFKSKDDRSDNDTIAT